MSNNKQIFEKFESLKSASFIGIRGYKNQYNEIADITLNVNVSIQATKEKDFELLENLKENDLLIISEKTNQPLSLIQTALDELKESAKRNLSENLEERTTQSQAQTDSYIVLTDGLKLHKDSLEVFVYGFQNQKKVIQEGDERKPTKKQAKTICKDAIKKYCDLKMEKYRTYKLGQIDSLKITGDTIQII